MNATFVPSGDQAAAPSVRSETAAGIGPTGYTRRLRRDVGDAQLVVTLAEARIDAVVVDEHHLRAVMRPERPAHLGLRRKVRPRSACASVSRCP